MTATDDLADRLDAIAEELTDRVLDALRAGAAGDEEAALAAKATERRLSRARRAVEKAAHLLRDPATAAD